MPSSSICPSRTRGPGRGNKPMTASDVMLLPLPDSPTRPRISPLPMANETPETMSTAPSSESERNGEIANRQHVSPRRQDSRNRGSRRSRSASPTRFSENAVSTIIMPGKNSSHDARVMKVRDSASMLPQLGMSGGAPSPRKSSDAAPSCAKANTKLACTSSGETRFGRMCLTAIHPCRTPCCAPPRHRFRRAGAR